jgi:hypothetical protein
VSAVFVSVAGQTFRLDQICRVYERNTIVQVEMLNGTAFTLPGISHDEVVQALAEVTQ